MKYIAILFTILFSTTIFASTSNLDEEYNAEFTDIIEFVYGEDLLSQGGHESIDMLFEGIDLDHKKLVDIGSGLGGVAFYLASKHAVTITGVDRVQRMVDSANQAISSQPLKGKVSFIHVEQENTLTSFEDDSVDIIFSKESLLHIKDKFPILKGAFRVLKPGGQLIILDWLNPQEQLGPNIKEMMEADGLDLYLDSEDKYIRLLGLAGFNDIELKNYNKHYIQYTQDNLDTLKNKKSAYIQKFGQKSYDDSIESWGLQKQSFINREVIVTRIYAIKPSAS